MLRSFGVGQRYRLDIIAELLQNQNQIAEYPFSGGLQQIKSEFVYIEPKASGKSIQINMGIDVMKRFKTKLSSSKKVVATGENVPR